MTKNKRFGASPLPALIKSTRQSAHLTQTQAGLLIHSALRSWQAYESGDRKLHPGLWELFQLKIARDTHNPNSTPP